MFSVEELQKINGGKGKHKGLIKDNFMVVYRRAVEVNQVKVDKLKELGLLLGVQVLRTIPTHARSELTATRAVLRVSCA